MYKLSILLLYLTLYRVDASNILIVCPFFGKSHSAFIHPIVTTLAEKGHSVTVITSNLIKNPPENVKQIQPDVDNADFEIDNAMFYKMATIPSFIKVIMIWNMLIKKNQEYLKSNAIQRFLREDDSHFDIVMVELFFQESYYAFAHKYKAPLVLLGTLTYWETIADFMGNPPTMSYLSFEFFDDAGDLGILQRTQNYALSVYHKYVYNFLYVPKHNELIKKHFGQEAPSVGELESNVSLVFFNTHYSIDEVRSLVPGIVEVGGVHLKPPKKLPDKIQQFLDGAEHGFIYFSLGSHLKSSSMPKEKLDAILNVFKTLKQRILWKWEDDTTPIVSDNVKLSKWVPQSDVLAHPKIRMFISQCGMLSVQEAVNRGVPILGLPVHGDQLLNMAKLEEKGMGIDLKFTELTEENFSEAVNKILNEPEYAIMAKEVSRRFNDRFGKPLETVTFWVEYVIRHKGAKFMKSKLASTSWIKNNLLDVYAVLLSIAFSIVYCYYKTIMLIIAMCSKKKIKQKPVKKSKKNK